MKYIPLDTVLAAIEKMKDSVPHYITMAEKGAYIDCVNDAVDKIHSLEAKEVDLEKEIQDHIKECLDIKFPTTDVELIKKDVVYTAKKFFELGLKARQQ